MLKLLKPRASQPQGAVQARPEFSWVVNFYPGPNAVEIQRNNFGTPTGGPVTDPNSGGIGAKFASASSQHWIGPTTGIPTAFPITVVCNFIVNSLSVAARIFQSGMTNAYAGFYVWVNTNGSGLVGYGNNTSTATGAGNYYVTLPIGTFVVGRQYTIAARLDSSSVTIAVNGVQISGTVSGSATTIATTGSPNVGRLSYAGSSFYTDATVNLIAAGTTAALNIAQLSANPWAIFQPRIIWIPAQATAGTTYTISPSGGVVLGGTGTEVDTKIFAPSGGVSMGGTGTMTFGTAGTTYTITPSGGVTMGGAGTLLKGMVIIPSGGVTMGGSGLGLRTKILTPGGGVTFAGTGSMTSNTSPTAANPGERTKVGAGT